LLLSEMKEFAGFPKATQRYIRRSLDIAFGRRDALECWARDEGEAASIRAQGRLYKQLDALRMQVPDDSGLDTIDPFMGLLITVTAFDLGQDRFTSGCSARRLVRGCRPLSAPLRRCRIFTPTVAGCCCNRSLKARPLRLVGRTVRPCSGRSGLRRSTWRTPSDL
jgi:hypothetical protein